MKYTIGLDKKSMWERFSKSFIVNLISITVILLYLVWSDSFSLDLSNIIADTVVFSMWLYGFFINVKWNKIYIYTLDCDERVMKINCLSFNKEKQFAFDKNEVEILMQRVQVTSLVPKFKLILKQNESSLIQYSTSEWDKNKMKEIYENLIKWKNN